VVPRRQIHVEALDALGDFTAKTQDNPKMPANLASLLLKYLKVVPKGTGALVFLPKYALIRRIMEDWEYSGVLSQLKALVGTVVAEEPGGANIRRHARGIPRRRRGAGQQRRVDARRVPRQGERGLGLQG
jgi:Fanconi anemia group J protein